MVSLRVNNKFEWHEPRSFEFPFRRMAAGLAKLCAKGDQGGRRNRMAGCIARQLTEVTRDGSPSLTHCAAPRPAGQYASRA